MALSHSAFKHTFSILVTAFLLSGCYVSNTEPKDPEFTKDYKTMADELRPLITCEHVNVNGSETTTNNKTVTSELVIELVNPKNIPENKSELSKKIATLIRQDLKDPNSFDSYKVDFLKKSEHTSSGEAFTWPKDDLK